MRKLQKLARTVLRSTRSERERMAGAYTGPYAVQSKCG
ncbi:hypothetical protein SAMN05421507_13226 [Lentzea jiangxiensis]|uniref:Uncharacterized protein n=1 Tax=Lentzea jiangxiensis TaxID=641025 RepID=A0A1H0X3S4_9PSEU|nr:hypothetical protein SAMN05421507_13226 [Lentzea jiangxiensis]